VGSRLAVLDPTSGAVQVAGGASAATATDSVLQTSGPDADSVVVATPKALLSMDLSSGRLTTLSDAGDGAPAAPVRLENCVHAAWAGTSGGYVRSCDDRPATSGNLKNRQALVHPGFRVNRGSIVLNDLSTGAVWDLSNQRKVDNWSSVRPPPVKKDSPKNKDTNLTQLARDKPPK